GRCRDGGARDLGRGGGAGLVRQDGGRGREALSGMALEEGARRLGAQTLAHLLELPQFIRHACLVLAVAVDLAQLSHHRSIRSDFDVPVATTTHPAVWFPENVTAEPLSRKIVRKRTRGGIFLLARGLHGRGREQLAARDRVTAVQAIRIPRLSRQAADVSFG